MLGARHSWETGGGAARGSQSTPASGNVGARHPWESGNTNPDVITKEEGGELLVSMLSSLMLANRLSAEKVCVLCHWIVLSEGTGMVRDMAMKPGKGSGKYQEHLDKLWGYPEDNNYYKMKVPMCYKHDDTRELHEFAINPPP